MTKLDYEMTILGYYYNPRKRYSRYGYENLVDRARCLRQRLSNYSFTLKTARFKPSVVGG
jgi:hypothetical protein